MDKRVIDISAKFDREGYGAIGIQNLPFLMMLAYLGKAKASDLSELLECDPKAKTEPVLYRLRKMGLIETVGLFREGKGHRPANIYQLSPAGQELLS